MTLQEPLTVQLELFPTSKRISAYPLASFLRNLRDTDPDAPSVVLPGHWLKIKHTLDYPVEIGVRLA